jgi:hypothetical protein
LLAALARWGDTLITRAPETALGLERDASPDARGERSEGRRILCLA